jgi:hypothetical protein
LRVTVAGRRPGVLAFRERYLFVVADVGRALTGRRRPRVVECPDGVRRAAPSQIGQVVHPEVYDRRVLYGR